MGLMKAPKNGATVRMYRQGHGDCFLLAFPRDGGGDPVYVLIDCGYKPGSQATLHGKPIGDIVAHIGKSTGHRLDLAIITHEHQDHVNGIWKKTAPYFEDFEIREAWFAWTEDPKDRLAKRLRKKHKDQLLGLIEARNQLALAIDKPDQTLNRLDELLGMEIGGDAEGLPLDELAAAARDPSKSANKQGMKFIKDKAEQNRGVRYLSPGKPASSIRGTQGVRAFVLGPPRREDLLTDEDPVGSEGFHEFSDGARGFSFAAAARPEELSNRSPFRAMYHQSRNDPTFGIDSPGQSVDADEEDGGEVPDDAPWRRIDNEWLYSADNLALKLNRGINNTSLVLAFELPATRKVLLFVGDAQRGSWVSWARYKWSENGTSIDARDLLGRTVFYKVGHHGSHNATLDGTTDHPYANLSWMGLGDCAEEFTAAITAVNEWAMTKNDPPWRHPLPAIREALDEKCQGRVFQTDISKPNKPDDVSTANWNAFVARSKFRKLYFEYVVADE